MLIISVQRGTANWNSETNGRNDNDVERSESHTSTLHRTHTTVRSPYSLLRTSVRLGCGRRQYGGLTLADEWRHSQSRLSDRDPNGEYYEFLANYRLYSSCTACVREQDFMSIWQLLQCRQCNIVHYCNTSLSISQCSVLLQCCRGTK